MPLNRHATADCRPAASPSRRGIFALLAAALWTGSALAGAADETDACSGPIEQFERTLDERPACLKDPAFLLRLGRRLNQARRYDEAVDRLEAAVMLQPDAWPARLEYAVALEGVGDAPSAAAILAALADDPAVDPATREEIRQLQARVSRQRPLAALPSRTVYGLATGYDDNLLGSTRYHNFQLTLPEGTLEVEMHPDQRSRGGGFLRFDLSHEADLYHEDAARWRYGVAGSYRWSVDYAPANLMHMGALVERSPAAAFGWYTQALFQQLHRDGSAVLRQGQLGGGGDLATRLAGAECRLRLGGEAHWLAYPANELLTGRYHGLVASLACPAQLLQLQLRFGEDRPENAQRPGGGQRQQSLRVGKNLPLGDAASLAAEYEYYRQRDRDGYSPLLENNARRSVDRNIYRIEYRWRLHDLSPYVGFEWLDQHANLPLFAPSNRIFSIGLRGIW